MPAESAEPRQYWVRNDKGKVWGPLAYATIELLIDNGALEGRLQASYDGINFAFPGRFPDLRDAFPKNLWGVEGDGEPAAAKAAAAPPPPPRPDSSPGSSPGLGPEPGGPPVLAAAGGPPVVTPAAPKVAAPKMPTPAPVVAAKAAPAAVAKPAAAKVAPAPAAGVEGVPRSGDLSKQSPPRLYGLIAASGLTGRLTIATQTVTYTILFKKGAPEGAASDATADDLGTYLESAKVVPAGAVKDAMAIAANHGGDLVAALLALKLINPNDAFRVISEHATGILRRALLVESGTFELTPDAPMPASTFPLGNKWALLCEAVRRIPAPEVRRRLGANAELPVLKSGGKVAIEDLKLTPQEARVATYFDGVRSANELAAGMPQEADHIYRMAFFLSEMEIVAFAAIPARPEARQAAGAKPAAAAGPAPKPVQPPPKAAAPATAAAAKPASAAARPKPTPVAGTPAAAKPAPAPPPGVPKAALPFVARALAAGDDVAKLKALAAEGAKKDHFAALGLTREAQAADVKAMYFQLAKAFHPDSVLPGSSPEAAEVKSQLFARISEAWRVLGDAKLKKEYLDELDYGAEKVDVSSVFAAEETFQKACILVKARKFEEAAKMFDEAIRLNDKEGEFHAWRAYARFFLDPDRVAAKGPALTAIDQALKTTPRCAQAHYLAGQIHKITGDVAAAQKSFEAAVGIDPQHRDAQSELRVMQMRRGPGSATS